MATLPARSLPVVRRRRLWSLLQGLTLVGLAGTLVAFTLVPDPSLRLFWSGVVPVLPVLFLVHPGLWRNVCPLATLGMGPDSAAPGPVDILGWRVLLLLVLLIPLRHLGLEESALASSSLLGAAVAGAFLGRRIRRKGGFCNGWCPVLAVERLYGQQPLIELDNPRCPTCTVCTPRGCLDLSQRAATAQMLGPGRGEAGWLFTPLGAFAAAFPGLVWGFFNLPVNHAGGAVGEALTTYGWILGWSAGSFVLVAGVVLLLRPRWSLALPTLGAAAAGLYLWFALPGMAGVWGVPTWAAPLAWAGVGLVAIWWMRGLRAG